MVFSIANITGKKFFMSEKDYKNFYNACGYTIQGEWTSGAEYTKSLVVTDYREAIKLRALHLDYNSSYGGYVLREFSGDHGGVKSFISDNRYKADVLYYILGAYREGFIDGRA